MLTSSGSLSGIAKAEQAAFEFVTRFHYGMSVSNEWAD